MVKTHVTRDQTSSVQTYHEQWPVPALAGLVSTVWVQRVAADAAPYTHRNIPNGSVELRCLIGSVPQIVGPLTRPTIEMLAPGSTVVGLRFYPGAAPSVLGVPASVLVDLALEAEQFWGRSAIEIGERVAEVGLPEAVPALLQDLVICRLADAAGPDALIVEAVRRLMPWRDQDVGSLAPSLSISESQLRRRCGAAVGLAPKTLQRMLRFQGFLALAQQRIAHHCLPTGDGLALLAAEMGYADQSHLTRECVRLTGLPPRAFLRETERHCGGGHDHTVSSLPLLPGGASLHGGRSWPGSPCT
jgi:AraC-like DNA-binding protein